MNKFVKTKVGLDRNFIERKFRKRGSKIIKSAGGSIYNESIIFKFMEK